MTIQALPVASVQNIQNLAEAHRPEGLAVPMAFRLGATRPLLAPPLFCVQVPTRLEFQPLRQQTLSGSYTPLWRCGARLPDWMPHQEYSLSPGSASFITVLLIAWKGYVIARTQTC